MPRFQKGQSGNPSGRPKVPAEIQTAARAHSLTAIQTLASICTGGTDENARIKAAEALLNRAWGKPVEAHELTCTDATPPQPRHDLSKLTCEELETLHDLSAKMEGKPTRAEVEAARKQVREEY